MSTEPAVIIRLEDIDLAYRPGRQLSGEYWIESLPPDQLKAIEASVLWYTEGKGDEDLAIHEFWRRDIDDDFEIDPTQPERFATTLPNSPLSYEGQIVKIRWCVRVRVFLHRGKEIVGEKHFHLDDIHSPRAPST
jgi:hypothetical protein